MIGDSFVPLFGQPSLTRDEVIQLYQKYGLSPSESDIASELENANKYPATGIEAQIAKRATNVPGTGVAPIPTITPIRSAPSASEIAAATPAPPPVLSVVTAGPGTPAATAPPTVGSTGLANPGAPVNYATMQYGPRYGYGASASQPVAAAPSSGGGIDMFTILLLAGVALAGWYLVKG